MGFGTRALLAVVLGLSTAAAGAQPIRIGLSGPFTGGSAPMGTSMRDGIRLAAAEINAAGGLLGRQIELVERDDRADNRRGKEVARELIERERVAAVVGFVNTGVALASQHLYQQARIPVMNSVATGSLITRQFARRPVNYIFRTAASDTIQSRMIVAEALGRGFTRLAILADRTNYGELGRDDLLRALKARGMRPVLVESYDLGDLDMRRQLVKAREAGAEAVLTYGIGPELARIANDMESIGWKVPMIGSWTLSMANFLDGAGHNAEGARMPQTFLQEPAGGRRAAFVQAYLAAYAPPDGRIPSAVSAAQGYDAMHLLAAAIRQAGSTEGPKIVAALQDLREEVDGAVATYRRPFSGSDHEAIEAEHTLFGEVREGRVVLAR